MFDGFKSQKIDLGEVVINLRHKGAGPPVLMLHGYPKTHAMWHAVGLRLTEHHTVVVADPCDGKTSDWTMPLDWTKYHGIRHRRRYDQINEAQIG